ncbi:DEAD/DEAH box helicase [Arthrobacter sp. 31Y]|uniref:DEAD/DEAH box helicase n=1 Tax=Arthrobacter sp. 31Y TaxID=1115632 RepID=UPI0004678C14|nr:DEAD/DEAH box helicase [Arthrobacter sp. 31Y]
MGTIPHEYTAELEELAYRRELLRAGTLPMKPNRAPSREVFFPGSPCGPDTEWVEIWSELGELLNPLFLFARRLGPDSGPAWSEKRSLALDFAGSESRLVYNGLDIGLKGLMPRVRGERVLSGIIQSVDELLADVPTLEIGNMLTAGSCPLDEEDVEASRKALTDLRWKVLEPMARLVGMSGRQPEGYDPGADKGASQEAKDVWLRGILQEQVGVHKLPGIMLAAKQIARNVLPESVLTATFDDNGSDSLLKHLNRLPPKLADRLAGSPQRLLEHRNHVRDRYEYEETGIEDPGTTELDRLAFRYLLNPSRRESVIIVAPTSSGKSRFGHLAISVTVNRRKLEGLRGNVIVLAPTKALVNQTARDLRELFAGIAEEPWDIIEGTRDHPQHDERLRTGKFDVAICIPEKVAALRRLGMSMDSTPLIVVDELQHLVDESRGQALELLILELFRAHPDLRWIGLSASLSQGTRDLLKRWFDANGVLVSMREARYRPVPLAVAATDGTTYEMITTGRIPSVQSGRLRKHDVSGLISRWNLPEVKKAAKEYDRVLSVILSLLHEHVEDGAFTLTTPSILVFMNSRKNAEKLAMACRLLVQENLELRWLPDDASAFTNGRFRALRDDTDWTPNKLHRDLHLMPPNRVFKALELAARTGIGFHTSMLDGLGRELMEETFRLGYTRILFATDTLKLGVNTPTDIVINADMLSYSGDHQRVLDKDDVIQRLGRAGRFLVSQGRGSGYLVLPKEIVPDVRLKSTLAISNAERRGLGGSVEAADSIVLSALTKASAVAAHYLQDWSGGAHYLPPIEAGWLGDAALQLLVRAPGIRLEADKFEEEAGTLYGRSLAGLHKGDEAQRTLPTLEARGVVVVEDDIVRPTRLGHIAATNSQGSNMVDTVKELAQAAEEGAGPFTLLYFACLSPLTRTATYQMVCQDNAPAELRNMIAAKAKDVIKLNREEDPIFFRGQRADLTDVVGTGRKADELRFKLDDDRLGSRATTPQLTALWRAAVLLRWWGARPFAELERLVPYNRIIIDETDARQLAQIVATLIDAAGDYLGSAPTDMVFRSLSMFASELEIGLPIALAPLVRMNHRATHRERLSGMVPMLLDETERWDDLEELLDRYVERSGGTPMNGAWQPLRGEQTEEIRVHLKVQRDLHDEASLVIGSKWADKFVPRSSMFTMDENMSRVETGEGLRVVAELAEPLGLRAKSLPGDLPRTLLEMPNGDSVLIVLPHKRVDREMIRGVLADLGRAKNAIILAVRGASEGVLHRSRFLSEPCAVVAPSLFLEMLARVYERFVEVEDSLSSTNDNVDTQGSTVLLGRLLINNAPVLTRNDLENRMMHDFLAKDVVHDLD